MYFGPGIEVSTNRTEFWHGTLWQESPLFGCEKMTINNSKSSFIKIRNININNILYY